MPRIFLISLTSLLLSTAPQAARTDTGDQHLIDSGNRLAAVLRAGRSVVSENQALINDPAIGDKGLTPEAFLEQVVATYAATHGEPPVTDGLTELQTRLTEAQLAAMGEVIAEAQDQLNDPDIGFKGFIPAIFARLTNERFGEKVGDLASIKVTAPPHLVRNRKARPDAWEAAVIEQRFLSSDWQTGASFEERTDGGDGEVFRMLLPEYYSASCLSCHGQPAGEVDVTGFPKEGGAEGDLGGAISITLKP
ncbi:Tll0287-like domain-containing protein [Tropicimonas sediminicola]|uniref:Tll0287-like domain-containing protein n=1 Tax=Tropicimonas sediminicola TaxID=1031541 RepID=A0A239LQH8_9RHOB|nr:DUF3365 domain-containing protein [Tropicimonas sediminicola]SNT32162.1 Protein of unknown function [Tropicimonas sediminicola]